MADEIKDWKIDKTGWADGPWMREPDRVEWRNPRGIPCLIVRNRSGVLCGYVGVPPGHPWHGKSYDSLYDAEPCPDVHGGLTFSAPCMGSGPVCHVPRHGEPDNVWWLGFDTAHCDDFIPSRTKMQAERGDLWAQPHEVYRTLGYVRANVESLAEQVIAARLGATNG